MMPIIYPVQETVYVGNGIGVLSDVLYCRSTEVLNNSYELEFRVPKNGKHAEDIFINSAVKVRSNYSDNLQIFRIYFVDKDYDGYITVKAAHISYDTAGIPILPFTANNLDEVADKMNTGRIVLNNTPFVFYSDFQAEGKLEVKSPVSFRSLLGGSDNSIIGVYGGEYHYNNYAIEHLEKRGYDRGVIFRYGKNITGFEEETNADQLYSAVIGFWKKSNGQNEEDTLIYGNIVECEGYFPYDKILIVDASSDIKKENDAVPTADEIDSYVASYIAKNSVGIPVKKMKINYIDDNGIANVCVGDTVRVIFPDYGINVLARCNKVVFDCLLERNESIEIGVVGLDLSDTIADLSTK